MPVIDAIILIITILIVLSIVFFEFVYPKIIKGSKTPCSSCPHTKRARRAIKKYVKQQKYQSRK